MRTQALFFFFPLIPPTSVTEHAPKMFERYEWCCPEKQEANNCKSVGVIDCALTWRADVQAGIEKQWRRGRLQAQLPPPWPCVNDTGMGGPAESAILIRTGLLFAKRFCSKHEIT